MKKCFVIVVMLSLLVFPAFAGGQSGASAEDASGHVVAFAGGYHAQATQAVWDTSQFAKDHPNLTYEAVGFPYNQYVQKMKVAMAAGETDPDLIWVHGRWNREFIGTDLIMDITDKIDYDSFGKALLNQSTYDGKVYGTPYELTIWFNFYREDIMKEYGLTFPETWDEYFEVAEALRAEGKWFNFFQISSDMSSFFTGVLATLGGDIFDDDGKVILDAPEGKGVETAQLMKRLAEVSRDLGHNTPEGDAALAAGEVVGNLWAYHWPTTLTRAIPEDHPSFGKWRVGDFPLYPGTGTTRHATERPLNVMVSSLSDVPDAAVEILKFFTHSEEGPMTITNDWMTMGGYKPALRRFDEIGIETWSPLFGGQSVNKFYADVAMNPDLAMLRPNRYAGESANIIADHLTRMLSGEMTPEQMITETANAIRTAIR